MPLTIPFVHVSCWAFSVLNTDDKSEPAKQTLCLDEKSFCISASRTRSCTQWISRTNADTLTLATIAQTMTVASYYLETQRKKCPVMRNIIRAYCDSFIVTQKTSRFLVWLFCAGFFQVSGACWLVRIQCRLTAALPHGEWSVALNEKDYAQKSAISTRITTQFQSPAFSKYSHTPHTADNL